MSTIEQDVARHYMHGSLEQSILAGLAASQAPANTVDELGAVDEFHIGGREATAEIASQLFLERACVSWTSAAASAARHGSSPRDMGVGLLASISRPNTSTSATA
jgi:hypothetical protein